MILKIFVTVVVVIAILVVIIAMRPSDFRITRKAAMAAPAAKVFTQVNDLHNWEAWSPWAKLDPAAKMTYEGPAAGTGAGYVWDGNSKVGAGRMTITESRPNDLVRMKLEFYRPIAGVNDVEFTFVPDGNQTVVTWTMTGKYKFISKAFGLIVDCDKMVGGMFEQGLAQMKTIVEAKP